MTCRARCAARKADPFFTAQSARLVHERRGAGRTRELFAAIPARRSCSIPARHGKDYTPGEGTDAGDFDLSGPQVTTAPQQICWRIPTKSQPH